MRRILYSIPMFCLLVLPLCAQDEALHGTWEGSFVDEEGNNSALRLTFREDGAFELDEEITLGEAFQSVVASTDIPLEKIIIEASGTYEVDGDKIRVDLAETEILADGRDYWEILTEVARALAALTADLAGIPEADYPAFEQTFLDDFLGGLSEERFLAGFDDEVTWAVEGDTLTITAPTEDGVMETMQYQRVAPSAVAGTTWGRLKANGLR